MDRRALRHSEFFEHMEEFGYFSDLERELPDQFTSVFEIARVLEDEDSELFNSLREVLTVASPDPQPERKSREWRPNRHIPSSQEFDVDFIRSIADVRRILPGQHLLPEEAFMQRLARRTLLMRVHKNPVILPFGSSSSDYSPNNFKQKVYLLLDTSASMIGHHRFQMAKAVAYVFLKRNLRELGHVYFRTFDRTIGELVTATDAASLRALIRRVMRLRDLGNGTAMEQAILTAADDIREESSLSGAEILLITDGAAHLDKPRIQNALGDSIRINCVKIGDAAIAVDDKWLRDEAALGSSPKAQHLANLEEKIRALSSETHGASHGRSERIEAEIRGLRAQAESVRREIVGDLREEYGREIVGLSSVYVEISDIATDSIFKLDHSQLAQLRELVESAQQAFRAGVDAETLKEVTLLYEHVSMLLDEGVDESTSELNELRDRLSDLIDDFLQSTGRTGGGAARRISRDDLRDVAMMLQHKSGGSDSLLQALVRMVQRLLSVHPFRKVKLRR